MSKNYGYSNEAMKYSVVWVIKDNSEYYYLNNIMGYYCKVMQYC